VQRLPKTGHGSPADVSQNRPEAPLGFSESLRGRKPGINSSFCTQRYPFIVAGLERRLQAQRILQDLLIE
jgi:hypothetical protein